MVAYSGAPKRGRDRRLSRQRHPDGPEAPTVEFFCRPGGSTGTAARQSRNQRQEALTAEYAEYAENRLLPSSASAYSAYSAVYLFPEDSSQPANNFHYCSAGDSQSMKRSEFQTALRAAARVAKQSEFIIIGSQAIRLNKGQDQGLLGERIRSTHSSRCRCR